MALQLTQTENGTPRYTINNWQEGIADSPELGFANMRNIEIGAIQGEILPTFKSSSLVQTPKTATAYTVTVATPGVFTSNNHGLTDGACIQFSNSGGSLPSGLSTKGAYNGATAYVVGDTMEANGQIWYAITAGTGNPYTSATYWREAYFYVQYLTANTFTVRRTYLGTAIQVTGSGSGTNTYATFNMAIPKHIASYFVVPPTPPTSYSSQLLEVFVQDSNGVIWFKDYNASIFAPIPGNSINASVPNTLPGNGNGMCLFAGADNNIWLIACTGTRAEFLNVTSYIASGGIPSWNINNTRWNFQTTSIDGGSTLGAPHKCIVSAQDNRVYFTDGKYITSLIELATKTFSPTDNTTNSFGIAVTLLPGTVTCSIEELSTNLVTGDLSTNRLFVWDRNSSNYNAVWRAAENGIFNLLNVNNTLYILAGNKGVVYSTQGYIIDVFKKIPEYITGGTVFWGGIARVNGHLLVGLKGSGSDPFGGVYKIYLHTLEKGTLVCDNTASDGLTTTNIVSLLSLSSDSYLMGTLATNNTTGGIDIVQSSNYRYTDGSAYIETQLLSVSDVQETRNFQLIGLELGRTLATGETITVTYRETPKESYSALATFDFASVGGIVNDYKPASMTDLNALQLKVALTSASSTSTQTPRLKTIIVQ